MAQCVGTVVQGFRRLMGGGDVGGCGDDGPVCDHKGRKGGEVVLWLWTMRIFGGKRMCFFGGE